MTGKEAVTLRDYVDSRFAALASESKVTATNLDARLHSMNEFRDSLRDQAAHFITRPEHDSLCNEMNELKGVSVTRMEHEGLIKDINSLKESRALLEGKASQQSVNIAYAIGTCGLALSIVSIIVMVLLHYA